MKKKIHYIYLIILILTFASIGGYAGKVKCRRYESIKYSIADLMLGYSISCNDSRVLSFCEENPISNWRGDMGDILLYSGYAGLLKYATGQPIEIGREYDLAKLNEILAYIRDSGLLNKWEKQHLLTKHSNIVFSKGRSSTE